MTARRAVVAALLQGCRAFGIIVLGAWTILLGAGPGAAETPAYDPWFKVSQEALAGWRIEVAPGDANRLTILPRQPGAAPPHRILVLYPRASSAYDIAIGTILGVFQERDIEARFTVINFGRDDARGNAALAEAESGGDELVLSMGSESTAWLFDHYRGGRLPVVTVCSKDPVELHQMRDYENGSGTNLAFTSLNMPVAEQMAYLREIWPGLKNIGVLVDSRNESAVRTQSEPLLRLARAAGINGIEVAVKDRAMTAGELQVLVPEAVATMRRTDPALKDSVFWVTGSTAVFREIETINRGADRVPVLSAVPDVVKAEGRGAVMSIGVGFVSNAHLAALYAADVLTGRAKAGELKVGIVSPPDIAVDFRRAREIGFRVPFDFFERASTVYDGQGRLVRSDGKRIEIQASLAAPAADDRE